MWISTSLWTVVTTFISTISKEVDDMSVRSRDAEERTNLEKTLAGILALLADEREQRIQGDRSAEKTELVLARAGLSNEQIAVAVGKNYDAVRKTITRARAA